MIKVKQLYIVWDDGDGHKYLIPKQEYCHFEKALERVEYSFNEHRDLDIYYEELDDLLSYFSKGTLEGELHYVVLETDLIEGEEGEA